MPPEKTWNMTNYEKEYADFKWEVPENFNFADAVVDKWARREKKLALWWVDDHGNEVQRTFREISHASKRIANALTARGVKPNDVLLLVLPRNIEWWETLTACIRMGVVATPGITQLTARDLKDRCNASSATCIVTNPEVAAKFETVADECPSVKTRIVISEKRDGWLFFDEIKAAASQKFKKVNTRATDSCLLYFTSGTSGPSKMVIHTHASYPIGHQVTGKYWLDLKPEDLVFNVSETGWAKAAWSSYFAPWSMGAAVFVHHEEHHFNPAKALKLLSEYPITVFCGAPTVYRMFVLEERLTHLRFPHLRHCVAAGEPLTPEIIQVWEMATGCVIRNGYGQTETTLLCGCFPCIEPRTGSLGKPAPGIELAVIDEARNILSPGTEGFIAVKTAPERPVGLFSAYWRDPDKTREAFRKGWYLTGDRAYVDEAGYFWFVGRTDDVIVSSGYRIGPNEVESALMQHPAVAEAAVVSSPDTTRGEIAKAFVITAPGFQPSEALALELQEFVKKVTAPYKYPREIEFLDVMPKTISGKIRRVDLRNREWDKTVK